MLQHRTMSSLALLITAALVLQVASQPDSYEPNGNNYPAFYTGDSGTVVCTFNLSTDIVDNLIGYGLRKQIARENKTILDNHCLVLKGAYGNPDTFEGWGDYQTDRDCTWAFSGLPFGQTVTLRIPVEPTEYTKYRCSAWTTKYLDHDVVLNVEELLVAPINLRMMFTPNQVYAGNEVTVMCMSEKGDPSSVFEYAIDGEINYGNFIQFTATKEYDGMEFSCKDMSHPDFNGGESPDTFKTELLTVYYFVATRTGIRSIERKPGESVNMSCNMNSKLPEKTSVSYLWKKDGVEINGEGKGYLIVNGDNALTKTIPVRYDCIAAPSDNKLNEAVLTWNMKALTPTAHTTITVRRIAVVTFTVFVTTIILVCAALAVFIIKKRNATQLTHKRKKIDPAQVYPKIQMSKTRMEHQPTPIQEDINSEDPYETVDDPEYERIYDPNSTAYEKIDDRDSAAYETVNDIFAAMTDTY